ncbi:hypothetical protein ECTW07945_0136, partial [Escherichia coli TW07945]
MAGGTP